MQKRRCYACTQGGFSTAEQATQSWMLKLSEWATQPLAGSWGHKYQAGGLNIGEYMSDTLLYLPGFSHIQLISLFAHSSSTPPAPHPRPHLSFSQALLLHTSSGPTLIAPSPPLPPPAHPLLLPTPSVLCFFTWSTRSASRVLLFACKVTH